MESDLAQKINSIILDMDGVLWRSNEPIGNLEKIFSLIRDIDLKFILATNNSTKTIEQYQEKLLGFNVVIEAESIITSGEATSLYLANLHPNGGRVFTIGEQGLKSTLERYNFVQDSVDPVAVIVGMDQQLTYDKLRTATLLIRSGTPFINTNPDKTFPVPEGLVPGAGSISAAIEAATDISPTIIGKPYPVMYQSALDRMLTSCSETLIVGDRLETDISGGQSLGCGTAVVLSGVATPEQINNWAPSPDFVEKDLYYLLKKLRALRVK